MTNDKELVEVWRNEFHAEIRNRGGTVSFDGRNADLCVDGEAVDFLYFDDRLNHCWHGFLMAKRSQPSVALSKPRSIDCSTLNNSIHIDYYSAYRIHDALTAAGIKYTIGE